MADYYYYRRKVENQKRRRRAVVALLAVVVLLCAAAGYLYFRSDQAPEEPIAVPAATLSPAPESSPATAEHAAAAGRLKKGRW